MEDKPAITADELRNRERKALQLGPATKWVIQELSEFGSFMRTADGQACFLRRSDERLYRIDSRRRSEFYRLALSIVGKSRIDQVDHRTLYRERRLTLSEAIEQLRVWASLYAATFQHIELQADDGSTRSVPVRSIAKKVLRHETGRDRKHVKSKSAIAASSKRNQGYA